MVGAQHLKPVVALKNREPELSCILAKLFNICLKEPCCSDCWNFSSVVPVFKNAGERSAAPRDMWTFFIPSIVLGRLDQLQIF